MTTYSSDDLTPSLVPPGLEFAGYGQGELVAFDRASFDSTVRYRGALLHNLPVKDRIGALTYQAGDVVQLEKWRPTGGGLGSYWIASSAVVPGPGRGEAAVAFLRGELAKSIAAQISAENITSATALGTQTRADTAGFEELTGGPSLIVDVSETGKVIVHLSASINGASTDAFPEPAQNGGRMGVELTGINSAPASADKSVAILNQVNSREDASPFAANLTTINIGGRLGTTFDIDGLTPGLTTFTAMYARLFPGWPVDFTDRTIVVVRS